MPKLSNWITAITELVTNIKNVLKMFSVNIDLNEYSVANLTPVETYTQWNTSMIVIESILIIFPKLSFPNLRTFRSGY